MKVELSKRLRARIRELAAVAHEREMRNLLKPLSEAFAQWQSGQKDTWSLLEHMDNVARLRRRLSQRYETNSIAPMNVAYALVSGLLREDEVPAGVLEVLERHIAFYRQ